MRLIIRSFFKTIRFIMGPFMLAYELLAKPGGITRDPEAQAAVDARTSGLVLYQFKTCPFCIKVRLAMARLSLNIEKRDAQHEGPARNELIEGGGEAKVPCLRISNEDGSFTWL
ncbi:MAG: glutaredoxin family protein, partial [Gammaproteobacteria bacterium]